MRFKSYYRISLPFDALAAHGHDIGTSYGWDDRAERCPVIVGQRVSKIEALSIWRRLRIRHRLVWETDDDIWSVDPSNLQAYGAYNGSTLDAAEAAIDVAHMVTVSTEELAKVLRKRHGNVVVLPNHIDGRLCEHVRPVPPRPTVGWAGGDSHVRDLAMVAPHLRKFLSRYPDWEWHCIGTDFRRAAKIPGRFTQWQANVWDYYRRIDFDIGIAPLVTSVFNSSKSHIKALEYSALGIPVVASDEPPYRDVVVHGHTGYLVKHEHEWPKYLGRLAGDPELRRAMGSNAREHARKWTIQSGYQLWQDAYASLL